jgi:hypothetical protein
MKKTYTFATITFGFSPKYRKWVFGNGKGYEFITPVPGGVETAQRIAVLVNGGLLRTQGKGLDGAARTGINKLTSMR